MPKGRDTDTDLTAIQGGALPESGACGLLLSMQRAKATGALFLRHAGERRELVFRQGQIWGVRVDRLEQALPTQLGLSEEQAQELYVEVIERGTPARQALARILGDSKLDQRLRAIYYQRLLALLAWEEGDYSWMEGERYTENAHDPLDLGQAIVDAAEAQGARAAQGLLRARRERPLERTEHYEAAKRAAPGLFKDGGAGALFESGARSFFDLVARGLPPEKAAWQLRALVQLGALGFAAETEAGREAPLKYVPRLLARARDEADPALKMTFARRADDARKLLKEISAKLRDPKPLSALRVLLREVEQWDGYVEIASQELKLLESSRDKKALASLYREMGTIHERELLRWFEAARYYEAALSLEPDEPTRAQLRDLLLDAGAIERAVELERRSAQSIAGMARTLWQRGKGLSQVLPLAEEALRQRPADTELTEFIAELESRDAGLQVQAARRLMKLAEASLSPQRRDLERARVLAEHARALAPDLIDPIELAEKVARARNDHAATAEAMLDALSITQEPRGRAELRRRLAALPLGAAFTQEHLEAQLSDPSTPDELRAEALNSLRTALGRVGEQARYAFFLEEEARRCQGTPREIPLVLELGQLYARSLNEPARAVAAFEGPLLRDPEQPELVNALRSLGRLAGWSGIAKLLARSALEGAWRDPRDPGRIRRLEEAARMMEERVLDPARASALWRKFDEFDPGATQPREAIRRIEAKIALQQGVLSAMEREVEGQQDPATKAKALKRLASAYHEQAHDAARAINAYARAWEIIPGDQDVISSLEVLYQEVQDWEGVARVLYHRLTGAEDPKQRYDLLWRYAQVCEERIDRPDAAASALAEILIDAPDDPVALSRLERLYLRAKDYSAYLGARARRAAQAQDAAARASIYIEMAELCERVLGDRERAAELWRWANDASPSDPRARRALGRLLRALGRLDELVQLYRSWAESAPPSAPRRTALLRQAVRLAREAGRVDLERELLASLLQNKPQDGDALARLAELSFHQGDAAGWFEAAARLLSARGVEPDYEARALALLSRTAEAFEADGREGEALALLRTMSRSVGAGETVVLTRLARLEESAGDPMGAVWAKEQALPRRTGAAQFVLAQEIATLWSRIPGGTSARILALQRLAALSPDENTLDALSGAYALYGEWGRVLELLNRKASIANEPSVRVAALHEIARVEEEQLGDAEAALSTLQRAYDEYPGEGFQALRAALSQRGMGKELVRLLLDAAKQQPDSVGAVTLYHEAASTALEMNQDVETSIQVLRQAFEAHPEVPATTDALLQALQETERFEEVAGVYLSLTARASGPARVNYLLLAARVRGQQMADAEGELALLERAYREHPEDPRTLPAFDGALRALARWEDLLACYEARSKAPDEATRRGALERMVEICRDALHDPLRAFHLKRAGLRLDRRDDLALSELEDLARAAAAYDELCTLYQALADHAQAPAWRLQLLRRKAHTREALQQDPTAALADMEQAFRVTPEDDALLGELIRLGDETGDRGPLLAAYVARRNAARAPAERLRYTLLAAEVAEVYQLLPVAAFSLYRDALALDPTRREIWDALRRITRAIAEETPEDEAGAWRRLLELFSSTASTLERELRVDLSLLIAEIQRERGELDGALATLEATLSLHPARQDTAARLESYARAAATLPRAAAALLREAELAETGALTQQFLSRAARLREEAGDLIGAVEVLRRLLTMAQNPQAAASLESLLERAGRYEELIKHHETVAASLRGGPLRRERMLTSARLWEEKLLKPKEATAIYQRLLQEQPSDTEAMGALIRLYEAQGEWRKLADLLERQAQQGAADAPRLYRRAGEIFAERLRLPRNATTCYEAALAGAPGDRDVLSALAGLYERQQRWPETARTLQSLAQLTQGVEAVPLLLRRAELLASRLRDIIGARGALEEALARGAHGDAEREIRTRLTQLRG